LAVAEVVIPWLVTAGLFSVLRRLETWLHQHIFKVGWLTTKDFQTTTILYYTFLLPGVVLHEVVYYLAAGLLNVRAERSIGWPKAQDIGELKLNFVKLAPRSSPVRVAIIATAPLVVGLVVIWYIANNVFRLPIVLEVLLPASLASVGEALRLLVLAPDFWLWFYLAFTVGNTMIPDLSEFSGYRVVGLVVGGGVALLTLLGLGNALVLDFLSGPVTTALNVVSGLFAAIIGINVVMVAVLATIEEVIERVTGDSADFRNGKMVVMTREERMERRMREIEKQRQAREKKRSAAAALDSGPPSIYKRGLPLPGGPDDEYVTPIQRVMVADEQKPGLPGGREGRAGASVIPGQLGGDEGRRLQGGNSSPQLPGGEEEASPRPPDV
jgi:hypothetical protein